MKTVKEEKLNLNAIDRYAVFHDIRTAIPDKHFAIVNSPMANFDGIVYEIKSTRTTIKWDIMPNSVHVVKDAIVDIMIDVFKDTPHGAIIYGVTPMDFMYSVQGEIITPVILRYAELTKAYSGETNQSQQIVAWFGDNMEYVPDDMDNISVGAVGTMSGHEVRMVALSQLPLQLVDDNMVNYSDTVRLDIKKEIRMILTLPEFTGKPILLHKLLLVNKICPESFEPLLLPVLCYSYK